MTLVIQIGLTICMLGIVASSYRLFFGPSRADRILALDTITLQAIVVLIGIAIYNKRTEALETVLIIALVGFIATVALAKFIIKPPKA